ncbi:filamentation induced by cAMP protein Fic [Desulfatibacillum aliphaticivorans]|uniref:Filamentation induced by cAMP protein Fic n=1 Tax=Desulfatibacillum aliphaticivorans TaxID=218208 RepID=B8FMZ1_DESAL|nr:Fic/DOC family N-terminal domain-containing protein [Desulfatibacillum aliphaticivorans]ACL05861.1 filamentation induced by cAMP protein Fic [Desulfatibacillum aliphaticivorans]
MTPPVHYHHGKFPPVIDQWEEIVPLLGPAYASLARYDGILSAIPNAALLLSPLTTQEAVLSSRIEGTQATMGDVLKYEADTGDFSPERVADIQEVLNYRKAMAHALERLKELPLCLRVIRESHSVLMQGVRGEGKAPGEFRKISNWIGPPGSTQENARFVPISSDKLPQGMDAWEKYLHAKVPDRLVQLAVLHAEFESLHPFLDGNGRLGRMIVPLFLFEVGLIQSPMFYISAYFENHRDEYYDRLLAVSRDGAWKPWCGFFLKAVKEQAEANHSKALSILHLYEAKKSEIAQIIHSQYAIHALDFIFNRPLFKASDFGKPDIPKHSAIRILGLLRENGLLEVIQEASGRTPAKYAFADLVNIVEEQKIF